MIEVRKASTEDAEGIVDVNLKTWRTTYTGIVSENYLTEREASREERVNRVKETLKAAEQQRAESMRFVAVDNGRVVGFANYGSCREKEKWGLQNAGEIYAIYVLQEYQGQGLGQRLVNAVTSALIKDDYDSMLIWALKDNPSVGFYKKIGGEARFSQNAPIGNQILEEVGFFYEDLNELLKRTA